MSARRAIRMGVAAALSAAALAPAAEAAPWAEQLVVFRDGSAEQHKLRARAATTTVGGRRCKVGRRTPLAVLLRSEVRPLRLRDYGSCSNRARDAAGLFVRRIGGDRNRGRHGWVYKVGNRVGTAGAGDPSGPFGRGRLRRHAQVTWFYCRMSLRTGSCQRTLGVKADPQGGGAVRVTVRAYDDRGRGKRRPGATVHAPRGVTATTGADGTATLQLAPGRTRVWATDDGAVRSFEERVRVR
jgi:hypothetical protein